MSGKLKVYRCLGPGIFHGHQPSARAGMMSTRNNEPDDCRQCDNEIYYNKNRRTWWSQRYVIEEAPV